MRYLQDTKKVLFKNEKDERNFDRRLLPSVGGGNEKAFGTRCWDAFDQFFPEYASGEIEFESGAWHGGGFRSLPTVEDCNEGLVLFVTTQQLKWLQNGTFRWICYENAFHQNWHDSAIHTKDCDVVIAIPENQEKGDHIEIWRPKLLKNCKKVLETVRTDFQDNTLDWTGKLFMSMLQQYSTISEFDSGMETRILTDEAQWDDWDEEIGRIIEYKTTYLEFSILPKKVVWKTKKVYENNVDNTYSEYDSDTYEIQIKDLEKILDLVKKANLTLNIKVDWHTNRGGCRINFCNPSEFPTGEVGIMDDDCHDWGRTFWYIVRKSKKTVVREEYTKIYSRDWMSYGIIEIFIDQDMPFDEFVQEMDDFLYEQI